MWPKSRVSSRAEAEIILLEARTGWGQVHSSVDTTKAKGWSQKLRHYLRLDEMSPTLRRIVVSIVGGTVLLIGVALIVLPGPAFVVIPAGLLILGTEYCWARRLVNKARDLAAGAKQTLTAKDKASTKRETTY